MNSNDVGTSRDRHPRTVWVLNLDAEHELERRGPYQTSQALQAIVARESRRLADDLVRPGDVIVDPGDPSKARAEVALLRERGLAVTGCTWSPTPNALALLEDVGVSAPSAPGLEILRQANARPFAASVREPLAGPSFAKHVAVDIDTALAQLARPAPLGWLVRRTFGAAGRGRRRVAAGRPTSAELAWLHASLRLGPLVLEPWVEVALEYTRSGLVTPKGEVHLSAPCVQHTAAHGAWLSTEFAAADELRRADDLEVEAAAEAAGRALAQLGYWGPFGIDAYRHRDPERAGTTRLNPLSEINARFTMDWSGAFAKDRTVRLRTARE